MLQTSTITITAVVTLALTFACATGCDEGPRREFEPLQFDAEAEAEASRRAFDAELAGHVEDAEAPALELQAIALEEASFEIEPEADALLSDPDVQDGCSGWAIRCCDNGGMRCCANLLGDWWCFPAY